VTEPLIVVTRRVPGAALDVLAGLGEVRASEDDDPLPRAELLRFVAGATAVVSLLPDRVDGELLDAAGPALRVVANVAVGYDNVDLEAATARGVLVSNTPGVLTDATADLALGLILAASRRLGEGERLIRAGRSWGWGMGFMLGHDLRERTLGIVGLGAIGRAVAARALAFGMRIAYTGPRAAPPGVEAALGARRLELDDLLAESDVVSLHVPLSEATRHLIDARRLALMRPEAVLVNTARGPIVDEAALAEALRRGTIRAAGLDVFEHEPQVHPALLDLENVVLVPHLGSATVETRTAMATLAARNVAAVLRGEPPPTPLNPEVLGGSGG
jgi:glyoxylate reductase